MKAARDLETIAFDIERGCLAIAAVREIMQSLGGADVTCLDQLGDARLDALLFLFERHFEPLWQELERRREF